VIEGANSYRDSTSLFEFPGMIPAGTVTYAPHPPPILPASLSRESRRTSELTRTIWLDGLSTIFTPQTCHPALTSEQASCRLMT
jgi:hypothetical protein